MRAPIRSEFYVSCSLIVHSCREEITVRRHGTGITVALPDAALFIFIGADLHTEWLDGIVCRDGKGFLVTGANRLNNGKWPASWRLYRDPYLLDTSVPGCLRWAMCAMERSAGRPIASVKGSSCCTSSGSMRNR